MAMLKNASFLGLLALIIFAVNCSSSKKNSAENNIDNTKLKGETGGETMPVIIYKMRGDYSKNVAVTVNEAVGDPEIIAYPHPNDVFTNGKLAYPTPLENGYWLDNRGISANTAFLSFKLDEYSKLKSAPELSEMYKQIIDADGITEMYKCGKRSFSETEISDLNKMILSGQLDELCEKLK